MSWSTARPHTGVRWIGIVATSAILSLAAGCAGSGSSDAGANEVSTVSRTAPREGGEPPPAIRDWMSRLTVEHAYDPKTGFIVARETIALPPVLADAPPLDEAVGAAGGRLVIAFATADRCAPCQQYKKDALNDPRVVARIGAPELVVAHVEVDRQGELAERYLGGRGIPMTYALRDGVVVATLRGQRSADDLLAWIDGLPGG